MKYETKVVEEAKKLRIIDDALFRLIGNRKVFMMSYILH